ncbi:MAG: GNAT family N-acetyltransferase [Paracoccaceae bacterium]|nr:GNAT family N-acetyltransferase [Paracoccaceae bacterium]
MIRAASIDDASEICGIWNPIIRDSSVTFNSIEKTPSDVAAMIRDKQGANQRFCVAQLDSAVVGFATYGQFRGGIGYQHTVEHSIILDPAAQGQGVGRLLMDDLFEHARANGMHSMFAGVSGENPAGVAFHAALGFETIGRLPEVGFKFGRWFDLVLMQKRL